MKKVEKNLKRIQRLHKEKNHKSEIFISNEDENNSGRKISPLMLLNEYNCDTTASVKIYRSWLPVIGKQHTSTKISNVFLYFSGENYTNSKLKYS